MWNWDKSVMPSSYTFWDLSQPKGANAADFSTEAKRVKGDYDAVKDRLETMAIEIEVGIALEILSSGSLTAVLVGVAVVEGTRQGLLLSLEVADLGMSSANLGLTSMGVGPELRLPRASTVVKAAFEQAYEQLSEKASQQLARFAQLRTQREVGQADFILVSGTFASRWSMKTSGAYSLGVWDYGGDSYATSSDVRSSYAGYHLLDPFSWNSFGSLHVSLAAASAAAAIKSNEGPSDRRGSDAGDRMFRERNSIQHSDRRNHESRGASTGDRQSPSADKKSDTSRDKNNGWKQPDLPSKGVP